MQTRTVLFRTIAAAVLMVAVAACQDRTTAPNELGGPLLSKGGGGPSLTISPVLVAMNNQLEAAGLAFRVHRAEFLAFDPPEQAPPLVVFADDRTFQIGTRWVPGDPRRGAAGSTLTYLVDQSDGAATGPLTNAQTEPAIDRAMTTWDVGTTCSLLPIGKVADTGADPDFVDAILGFGGGSSSRGRSSSRKVRPTRRGFGNPFLADITNAGWLPTGFFDALTPGGGGFILGVTFTFIFLDVPTGDDINGDGFLDTALKEVYYNNNFTWGIDADIDVETVALHENGHSLEQAHFGMIFGTIPNLRIHFAPRTVMNAAYSGLQQGLTDSDLAGHCTLFGSWPQGTN